MSDGRVWWDVWVATFSNEMLTGNVRVGRAVVHQVPGDVPGAWARVEAVSGDDTTLAILWAPRTTLTPMGAVVRGWLTLEGVGEGQWILKRPGACEP